MNRDAAGSLLAQPQSMEERELANYWRKRATIYTFGTVLIDPCLTLTIETVASLLIFQGQTNSSIDDLIVVKIVVRRLHR